MDANKAQRRHFSARRTPSLKSKLLSATLAAVLVASYVVQFQAQPAFAAPLTAPPASQPAILPLAPRNAPAAAPAAGPLVFAPAEAPAFAPTPFPTGTLIIPMDVISQNLGMWKAYGLVYRLLQNGIRVQWAIADNKTYNGIDFTASVRDLRTNIPISASYTYRGGPFIISAADAPTARTLINSWWAANANQPNVHVANADGGFTANVPVTLIRAPKIAQEEVNAGITMAYFNAAGIPDSNGLAWDSDSADIFDFTRIANGDLVTVNQCQRSAYDVYVTPHNTGFDYSTTDPNDPGTRAYAQLMEFVRLGGGWTATCHSIESMEDNLADVSNSTNPGVKALFTISNPIVGTTQITGGMLTITGFQNIQNVGGTWVVSNTWADLPVAQFQPTTNPQALPGGSVQTWLFNPSNVRYWPGVERVAYFTTTAGLQYDHIINGAFQGGKGAGKVTFIGGHSFATSLPYLGNAEAPYLRAFFNSLLFNGAGKAQLDLIPSPTSIPQNITSTVLLSITNIGGSEATNLNDLRVFLEPGVQYVSSTSPTPAVTNYPTGTLLVWAGGSNIGTIAPGATPIVITTRMRAGTLGENRIGYIYTQFGDVFGEGFTANYCRSITVVPAPNPILNKTPSPQTVVAGRPVSWTLTYANTGTAVLSNALVIDTLPAGFQYVSASSNPAVGAPLVTPLPNGTTSLIWSMGTLLTSTVVTRTIVITATSPGISQGTQPFTNTAALSGNAVGGVPISSGLKSAVVNVIQPALIINKVVTPTEATPGSVLTYTLALTYTDPVFFTNAVLTDIIPANTTYVAGSANAGGTFITAANTLSWTLGSNIAGVPGNVTPAGSNFISSTIPVSDTTLRENNPTRNYGTCTVLNLDSESSQPMHSLLQFSLAGIPTDAIVTSAILSMTKTAGNDDATDYGAYRVTNSWVEGTQCDSNGIASWNERLTAQTWITPGGDYTTAGVFTTSIADEGVYTWSVQSIVQSWVNGSQPNFGLLIRSANDTGNQQKDFASRENGTAANRPRLIISYTVPSSPATGVSLSSHPLLVSGNNQVTVSMVLTSAGTITNVVPPASLTVTPTNATATLASGPTPSGNFTITSASPVTLTYVYTVTPGTTPGNVRFGGAPASPAGAFAPAQSNSTLVVPILTFRVTVNTPLPLSVNQVANTATFRDTNAIPNGQTSPPALTTILQPQLEVTKQTLATDPVRPGDRITYTLSVLNFGTGPANNAVLRDAVPVSTTYVAGSCAGGTSCSLLGSTVVFTSASIPAFSTAVFTFAVTVNAFTVVGTYPITNVARITSTEVVTPEISNVVTNTMLIDPNIVGVKSAVSSNLSPTLFSNSQVEPGDRITYTLVFTNLGPGVATNVIISDPIDSDTTVVTPVPDSGSVITASGAATVTWPAIPSLGVGQAVTRTFVVSVNLPTGNGDIILNKATVVADSMSPRNTNETSFIVSSRPVLTVTKGSIPPPGTVLTYGQRITYSLVITNIGNANTNSAKLVDPLPDGVKYITNTTFINGIPLTDFVAGVPPASNMLVCSPGFCDEDGDSGALIVGSAAVITYQVQVLHPITQGVVLTNVATVNTPETPNVNSNAVTHSAQFPVLTGVVTDVLSGLPIPGATVVFTDAAGVVFTATSGIDGRYTFTSTPSNPIAYGPGTVTGSAAGYVPVPFDSSITIVNGINVKDVPLTRIASLQISKAGPASAVPGQQVTYTLRITNTGPSTATNVLLRDPAPAGLTFSSASAPCSGGLTPCNLGTINAGGSTLVTVTFNIGSAVTGTITNVASVTATEWLTPVVATATTPLAPIANLQIVKLGPATVKPGQQVTYSIIATNTGPSAASVVTIIDQPVAGMSLTLVSPPCAAGFPCVIPTGLAVGASVRLTVTFNVTSSVVGLITNTASITSPETPQPPTSTVTTTLTPEANLQIVKLGPATAVPGTRITYTLAVTNVGPSNASIITITDPTPNGLISPSVSAPCTGGFPCVITTGLAVSASVRLTVTFNVLPGAAGVITNTASVTSPETPEPPTSTVTTTLTPQADLQITKTAPLTATPGNTIGYQLVVFNAGPSDAPNSTISDTFPSQIAPASITWTCISSIAPCNNPSGSGTLAVTENISAGERLTYTIAGTVNSAATGLITNTATVTPSAGITDPVTSNNTSTVTTTLVPLANLQIKKLGPATTVPGTKITYTIAVTNAGPSAASVVTITDPTPAGLSNPVVSAPCATGFPCTLGSGLAVSQSVLLTVTFDVSPTAVGVITNTATVTSPETPEPPTSTVTTTLSPNAVLQIKKLGPATAVPGTQITYTIAVTNAGPSAATNVTVTDLLPAQLISVTITPCGSFPCSLGTLQVNESRLITVTGTITQSAVGIITNTAVVTSPVAPDAPTSTVTTTLTPLANLEIKKLGPATAVPGTRITYTIAVTNIGPSNASVMTITDPTPAGLSNPVVSAPCNISGFPCVITAGLAVGASVRLTVTFDVATTAVGVITNTASVTSPETPEPPTSTVTTTLTPQADIGVRKTAPVTATPGNQITYTVIVTNAGPSVANNVSVSDTFNTVLSGITWSCVANAGSTCNDTGGSGNISTTVNLTVGGQVTLFITGTIAPTATGILPNTVVITSPIDTTPGNNTSIVTSTLVPSADLSIVKAGPPDVIAGTALVYTLTVTNGGPSAASQITVTDETPAGLTFVAFGGACSGSSCTLPSLNVGQQVVVIVTFTVPADYTGTNPITNTAVVSASTFDPNLDNNTSTVTTPATEQADLVISKQAITGTAVPGRTITFTVVVTNLGPTNAKAVSVIDPQPAGLTFNNNSGACSTNFPCNLGTIPFGQTRVITSVYNVLPGFTGPTATNVVTVTSTTPDPVTSNNVASETVNIAPSADVSITKLAPPAIVPGTTAVFTINVTNLGPSNAQSVTVNDPTPAGLTFGGNSGDCTSPFPCAFASLQAGESRQIVVTFNVPAGFSGSTVTNTATVTSTTPDPVTSNNTSTVTAPVTPIADLSITKTDDRVTATPGTSTTYTVVVQNAGPSNASNVVVSDTLPSAILTVTWSCTASNGTCASSGSGNISDTVSISAGGRLTYVVNGFISAAATGILTNVAIVTPPITITDPVTSNNIATDTTTLAPNAVLQIKKLGPATAVPGTQITYTLAVTNAGPSVATGVIVSDIVPAEVTGAIASCGTLPCNLGTLGVNQSVLITLTGTITNSAVGVITNTASVTSPVSPDAPTSTVTTTLTPNAVLQIKKLGPATAVPGTQITYTIAVTNTGPSAATNVTVTDILPAQLISVTITPCGSFPCPLGTLQVNESRLITVTGTITQSAVGVITNTATVTSPVTMDPPTSTITTTLTPLANLEIIKLGPATATPGTRITYTIAVTNIGPSNASVITITDPTPAGLSNPQVFGPCSSFDCVINTGLAVGASVRLTVTFDVNANAVGVITNTATVTSPETPEPPTSTVTTTLTPNAVLQIKKLGPATAVPGTQITYTIAVTNTGPSAATNVTVTDVLPAELTNVTISGACSGFACNLGTLNVNQSVLITITGTISQSAIGVITNTASVSSPVSPDAPTSTVPTTLTPNAVLQIKKLGPATAVPGTQITYTIAVTNIGPSVATNVTVTDLLPAQLISVTITPCGSFPCPLGTLNVNQSALITVTATVTQSAVGVITNTATVTSPVTMDPPTSTVTTTLTPVANLEIKKLGPATAVPGTRITYTIAVTNLGPSNASVITITDPTPAGLSNPQVFGPCSSFDCVINTGLAVGASVRLTVTFDVNPNAVGVITNTASVTSPETPEPPTSTVTTTLTPAADLQITKTGPLTETPGNTISYQLVVFNAGPSNAPNATISDTFPTQLPPANISWTCASSIPQCDNPAGAGTLNTTENLSAGERLTYTVNAQIATTATGVMTNTAVVVPPLTVTDPVTSNNTSTVTTTLVPEANLQIKKIGPATAVPGTQITYTLAVTNIGPSAASIITITDPTPAGLSNPAFSGPCSGATCVIPTGLAVNASVIVTVSFSVNANAAGVITNTASVTSPETPEPPTSTVTTTLTPQADLQITKTAPLTATPGNSISYQLVVFNAGPSDAPNSTISDTFPSQIAPASITWTCISSIAPCNNPSGSGTLAVTENISAGERMTYTIAGTVNSAATGLITNTATVTPSAGITDPVTSNNTSTVTTTLVPLANLQIKKLGPLFAVPGNQITYTILVTNAGPSAATNVTVTDDLPAELTNVSITGACTGFACSLGTLQVNESRRITVTATVSELAAGTITNTAAVTSPVAPDAPTSTVVTSLSPGAELQIQKLGPATAVPGTQITYTIAVTNLGPSAATNVTVTDILPAQLTNVSISPCSSFPCSLGTLAVNESRRITVTATVSPTAVGVITNTASVTSPVTPNTPTSTVTTTLTPQANLQIRKLGPATATPGTKITYTLAVTNAGPSAASVITITDPTPAGLSNPAFSGPCSGATCVIPTGLAVNASLLVTVSFDVAANAVGVITNTASVTSPETPTPPTSTFTTTLTPLVNLEIVKLGPATAVPGTRITYTIAVTNLGPSNASVITITDPTPAGLSNPVVSAPCNISGFACVISTGLAVGASVRLTVTFDVNPNAVGVITNTASVTSPDTPEPPTSTVTTTLTPNAVLQIKKLGPATAVPGTQITYTIAVTNTGPSAATNVTVTDVLPAQLISVSIMSPCATGFPCTLGTLAVNESRRITVTATVNELALGTITNTATVTSPVSPDAPTSTVPTTLAPLANLEIKKLGPATAVPGTKITYTIAVTNLGPSNASVITITDPTPAGLSNPVVSAPCASGFACVITTGLAVNASIRLTVTFDVLPDAVGVITNTASVTSPETPEPPTSTVTTTVTPNADVGVLKTGPFTATPGTSIAYTVVVTNAGPSIATNVSVIDTLPVNVTGATWQCVAGAGSSCASSGSGNINTTVNLTVNGAITFTLNGTVLASATGQLVNTAVITTPADTTQDNNTSTVTTTLAPSATVTILKLGPATAVPGAQITYTISVANAGPSDATSAVVNDPTPAGLTFASATAPCAAGFPCSLGTVPAKSSTLITLTFNVVATATGQVVNTASVTTPVIPEPPTTTVTTTLTPLADLSVVKTVRASQIVTAGGSVGYDIVVRNAGPSAVSNAPVADVLPAEFTQGFWSCVASAGSSCQPAPGSGNINATVSLLPNGVATFTLDATIGANAGGTITNTATVTVPQGVTDTNPLNNTSSVTVTVAKSAFLGIFKTNNQTVSVPGTQVTYTIAVSNAGPSDASNITINDTFPAELQNPAWTCAGVNGAMCPANGSGNINTLVSLPVNSALTFTVKATVALNATGLLTNTASVQTPPEVLNTNPVTRSTDVDTLTPAVITGRVFNDANGNAALDAGEPGLSGVQIVITPSAGSPFVVTMDSNGLFTATVPPGAYNFSVVPATVPAGFALTTGNAAQSGTAAPGNNPTAPIGYQGRGTVSGVVFEDLNQNGVFAGEPVFPGTVVTLTAANCVPPTALSVQSAQAVEASCVFTAITGNDGRYSFTNVPAGPYTVTVGAQPGYNNSTPLVQSGTLAAGGTGTHDFGFFRPVGIVLNKVSETSLPNNIVGADRLITYTVIATNTGGVTATNVVITDPLPAFTQLVEGSITPAPAALSPLTWQIGSLAPGQSVTVRFTVRMDAGFAGVVRNVAFVSSPDQTTQPSNETVNTVQPTAIRLVSFTAERTSVGVRIAWQTSSEIDTFGFYVLRSTSNDPSTATRVNANPELGKGTAGGSYEVIDANAEAGVTYYYWLEEIELDETRNVYTEWMQRVAPLGDQNTRTFRVFVPAVMR
jgi:uncharacterized repeat protein (TIGR01451 family)